MIRAGLSDLAARYPDLSSSQSVCLFPAIEGCGHYPHLDGFLRTNIRRVRCAGDMAGRFRGLVPAIVSGHYAGSQAALELCKTTKENL